MIIADCVRYLFACLFVCLLCFYLFIYLVVCLLFIYNCVCVCVCDTFWVESLNHQILTYVPKRIHFGSSTFKMRLDLACMDWVGIS